MCDVRLFRSARLDFETAKKLWETPWDDEMILNNAAYHLQQAVEKALKGALECVGVTVPNTHKITKLLAMTADNGVKLVISHGLTPIPCGSYPHFPTRNIPTGNSAPTSPLSERKSARRGCTCL